MLFNPNFVDEALAKSCPTEQNHQQQQQPSLSGSYKMFSPTSPSPTRSMIKEANDHLQLLHQRVMELEKTVQEQAEALIKKDELMQQKLCELSEMKDAVIGDLKQTVSTYDQRVKKLEQQCRESNRLLDLMNQRCLSVEELDVYIPTLEKLLTSMRKLTPTTSKQRNSSVHSNAATSNCVVQIGGGGGTTTTTTFAATTTKSSSTNSSSRSRKMLRGSSSGSKMINDRSQLQQSSYRDVIASDGSGSIVDGLTPDRSSASVSVNTSGVANSMGQLAVTDLRIGRSFNINSNFSMSEDEDENDKYS